MDDKNTQARSKAGTLADAQLHDWNSPGEIVSQLRLQTLEPDSLIQYALAESCPPAKRRIVVVGLLLFMAEVVDESGALEPDGMLIRLLQVRAEIVKHRGTPRG
jgi:hypothetical protein